MKKRLAWVLFSGLLLNGGAFSWQPGDGLWVQSLHAQSLPEYPPKIPASFDESKYQLPGHGLEMPQWALTRTDLPFDVKAYIKDLQKIPAQNAAPRYLYAASQFSTDLISIYPEDLRHQAFEVTSKNVREWTEIYNRFSESRVPLTDDELRAASELIAPYLQLIDWAQERPDCNFDLKISYSTLLPHVQAFREVARMGSVEIAAAARVGDIEAVIRSCRRTDRLGEDLRKPHFIISEMVDVAMKATIQSAIQAELLTSEKLTFADCQKLFNYFQTQPSSASQDLVNASKIEYISFMNATENLDQVADSGMELIFPIRSINVELERRYGSQDMKEFITAIQSSSGTYSELYRVGDEHLQQLIKLWEAIKEETRNPINSAMYSMRLIQMRRPALYVTMSRGIAPAHVSILRRESRKNALQALIACKSWEIQHGKFPADGAELTRALQALGATGIPLDPFAENASLRYKLTQDGPLVYSVGENRIDDGGLVDEFRGRENGDLVYRIGREMIPTE